MPQRQINYKRGLRVGVVIHCQFVSIDYLEEGPVVFVKLLGACESCAMSTMTLKQGIEKKLMMEIPDVVGVVQVL